MSEKRLFYQLITADGIESRLQPLKEPRFKILRPVRMWPICGDSAELEATNNEGARYRRYDYEKTIDGGEIAIMVFREVL